MPDARGARRIGVVVVSLVLLTSCTAAAATPRWQNLRSVRVTVSRPSLPPPSGNPRTTDFTPGHGLLKAQSALNANGIFRPRYQTTLGRACTGGYNASIRIVKRDYSIVKMSAYRCANMTSGSIGGNLPGFLRAVGVRVP
jgi:hypothetical protein